MGGGRAAVGPVGFACLEALDDGAMLLDKPRERVVSGALVHGQRARRRIPLQAQQPLFLQRPLLGEVDLVEEDPAVELSFDRGQAAPLPEAQIQLPFDVLLDPGRRLSDRASPGMLRVCRLLA